MVVGSLTTMVSLTQASSDHAEADAMASDSHITTVWLMQCVF